MVLQQVRLSQVWKKQSPSSLVGFHLFLLLSTIMLSVVTPFGRPLLARMVLQTTQRRGHALLSNRYFLPSDTKGIIARQAQAPLFQQSQSFSDISDGTINAPSSFYTLKLSIPTSEDMEEMGALLSVLASPPDAIFLDGDLGAGKTSLARGFVLCKTGQEDSGTSGMRVTSPTYLLSNTYLYQEEENDDPPQEIHHMDLYRLSGTQAKEFAPLHLDHVFENCISLIEWPSRLSQHPQLLPSPTQLLEINICILPTAASDNDERVMTFKALAGSSWANRLQHLVTQGMVDDLIIMIEPEDTHGASNDQ